MSCASPQGKRPPITSRRWSYIPRLESLEARAVPTTVTSLADAGPGSLRQAILDTAAGGLVDFQPGLTGTIALSVTNGELDLTKDLTIAGPGADQMSVSGMDRVRVFQVEAGVTATFTGLTLKHGHTPRDDRAGGGLWNAGTVTVRDCVIRNNQLLPGSSPRDGGAGIWNAGRLTLLQSTVSDNLIQGAYDAGPTFDQGASIWNAGSLAVRHSILVNNRVSIAFAGDGYDQNAGGGGLWNTGQVTVSDSLFQANVLAAHTASGNVRSGGGAIANAGTLHIRQTLFVGNSVTGQVTDGAADEAGGAIINSGQLRVIDAMFRDNSVFATVTTGPATGQGGAITNAGTLTMADSDLAGNSVSASVTDGTSLSQGGALANSCRATVVRSTLRGNSASATVGQPSGDGGGVWNAGTLTVTDSTLSGNDASWFGGGVSNRGVLTIVASTITANTSTQANGGVRGAGLFNGAGSLLLSNATVSGNVALSGDGGGLYNLQGQVTITNSTLSGNAMTYARGGGIFTASPDAVTTLRNTLVAANSALADPDVSGALDSQGHNLIGDGSGGFADSDLVGSSDQPLDPRLGPLQNNGGPTPTQALLPGSPAIDAGDNTGAPEWDQRGPGYARIVHGVIDIGAFEVQARCTHPVRCSVDYPVGVPAAPPRGAAAGWASSGWASSGGRHDHPAAVAAAAPAPVADHAPAAGVLGLARRERPAQEVASAPPAFRGRDERVRDTLFAAWEALLDVMPAPAQPGRFP